MWSFSRHHGKHNYKIADLAGYFFNEYVIISDEKKKLKNDEYFLWKQLVFCDAQTSWKILE